MYLNLGRSIFEGKKAWQVRMSALQTPIYKLREKFKTIMEGYI
jgi:hypothetical protein